MDTGKQNLIKRVQEIACLHNCAASATSVDAIRRLGDEKLLTKAIEYVSMADDRSLMEKDVIEAIHSYWPG